MLLSSSVGCRLLCYRKWEEAPSASWHSNGSSRKKTQTSEPLTFSGPEFSLPFRQGRGEGSGNQKADCLELENTVDKARAVYLKRTNLLLCLYHMEFFEIFFKITLKRVCKKNCKKSLKFFFLEH